MEDRTPRPTAYFPAAVFFALIGYGGLFYVFTQTLPTLGPRWFFFFLIVVAITGTFLPVTAFLNFRFPSQPPASSSVITRQALWFGVYAATLAWLQYGRVYNANLALIFLVGFAFIEVLIRLWEQARWRRPE